MHAACLPALYTTFVNFAERARVPGERTNMIMARAWRQPLFIHLPMCIFYTHSRFFPRVARSRRVH